jgi:hypothetical protein
MNIAQSPTKYGSLFILQRMYKMEYTLFQIQNRIKKGISISKLFQNEIIY